MSARVSASHLIGHCSYLYTRLHLATCLPASSLMFVRQKSKPAKKQKKTKKDIRKEMMRDYLKRMELEKELEEATLKVAKKGEPMDPEMLNPARKRPAVVLSETEKERRVLLMKQWSRYSMAKHNEQLQHLQVLMNCRVRALRELRKVSTELYCQALNLQTNLFPFERIGPTETPPLQGYQPPELQD